MKKFTLLLAMLGVASQVNAATLLTVNFDLPDDSAKCTYRFFDENNQVRYEANPINTDHCSSTVDTKKSTVNSIFVTLPITKVMIDGKPKTCTVQVNRLSPTSSYVYSFVGSDRDCGNKVKVTLNGGA